MEKERKNASVLLNEKTTTYITLLTYDWFWARMGKIHFIKTIGSQ